MHADHTSCFKTLLSFSNTSVSCVHCCVHDIILQAAASCYIELIVKESDNNVKLIVLDRLIALKDVPAHERVLQVRLCWTGAVLNFVRSLYFGRIALCFWSSAAFLPAVYENRGLLYNHTCLCVCAGDSPWAGW